MSEHLNLTCNKCDNTFTSSIDMIIRTSGQISCPVCNNLLMSLYLLEYAISQRNTNGKFYWLVNEMSEQRHIINNKKWKIEITD